MREYVFSFFIYCTYLCIYILDYIYSVSFGRNIAELLLRVSLNERYALMIQLISPTGAFKNNDEDIEGGVDLGVRKDFEIVPWKGHRGKRCVSWQRTSVCVCEGYTSKGTNERVEATPRHATPKNPRDSAVFCE